MKIFPEPQNTKRLRKVWSGNCGNNQSENRNLFKHQLIKNILFMKKLAFLLIGLVALQATAFAADDKPVKVTDLPQTAQQFISDHFSGHKVAMAKMDSELFEKSYEVIFTNGDKVEFDRSGEWTEVQYREGAVPAAIVPAAITIRHRELSGRLHQEYRTRPPHLRSQPLEPVGNQVRPQLQRHRPGQLTRPRV